MTTTSMPLSSFVRVNGGKPDVRRQPRFRCRAAVRTFGGGHEIGVGMHLEDKRVAPEPLIGDQPHVFGRRLFEYRKKLPVFGG